MIKVQSKLWEREEGGRKEGGTVEGWKRFLVEVQSKLEDIETERGWERGKREGQMKEEGVFNRSSE